MRSGGKVVTCMFRQFSRKFGRSGTDFGRGHVVHDVGKIRAVGAALVAAGMVLSGCASGDGEGASTTTSPAATEPSSNPWDLPIEQRPALFDPCAELPVEAVEAGFGPTLKPDQAVHHNRPGELHSCGWKNNEVLVGVVGTWLSKQGFLEDRELVAIDTESVFLGRPGLRATDRSASRDDICYQIFFTSRGAVVVNVNLLTALREFRGERSSKACEVLDQTIGPIVEQLPEGDFS